MHTLNYTQFRLLRSDPAKYWTKQYGKDETELDKMTRLVKVMLKNPKMVEHIFVQAPDVSNEDPKGVLMQRTCASMVLEYLALNSEIPKETYDNMVSRAISLAELPKDYVPTDKLTKYGEYLLIRDERTEITKEFKQQAEKYVISLRTQLYTEGVEQDETKYHVEEPPLKNKEGHEIWLNLNHSAIVSLKNEARGDKLEDIIIKENVDHMVFYPSSGTTCVTNIYICECVSDFPETYKAKKLHEYVAFQQLLLERIFKKLSFYFMVADKHTTYSFKVGSVVDIKPELTKALYTLHRGSYLPYEYETTNITL